MGVLALVMTEISVLIRCKRIAVLPEASCLSRIVLLRKICQPKATENGPRKEKRIHEDAVRCSTSPEASLTTHLVQELLLPIVVV